MYYIFSNKICTYMIVVCIIRAAPTLKNKNVKHLEILMYQKYI